MGLPSAKTFGNRSQTKTISPKMTSVLTQLGTGAGMAFTKTSARMISGMFTSVSVKRITLRTLLEFNISFSNCSATTGSRSLQRRT